MTRLAGVYWVTQVRCLAAADVLMAVALSECWGASSRVSEPGKAGLQHANRVCWCRTRSTRWMCRHTVKSGSPLAAHPALQDAASKEAQLQRTPSAADAERVPPELASQADGVGSAGSQSEDMQMVGRHAVDMDAVDMDARIAKASRVLQDKLQHSHITFREVIGQGGCGTVYRGAPPDS